MPYWASPPGEPENIPIPDEHYAALGKVADAWADLEFDIDQFIWKLLRTEQALGACITAQMISSHPRFRALYALVRLYAVSDETTKEIGTLSGEVAGLQTRRNRIIHDKRMMWAATKEVVRFQVTAEAKLQFGPQPEPIESLAKFVQEVMAVRVKFDQLRKKIEAEIDKSPGKWKSPLPQITRWSGPQPEPTDKA
jgi:hypothetical protein